MTSRAGADCAWTAAGVGERSHTGARCAAVVVITVPLGSQLTGEGRPCVGVGRSPARSRVRPLAVPGPLSGHGRSAPPGVHTLSTAQTTGVEIALPRTPVASILVLDFGHYGSDRSA